MSFKSPAKNCIPLSTQWMCVKPQQVFCHGRVSFSFPPSQFGESETPEEVEKRSDRSIYVRIYLFCSSLPLLVGCPTSPSDSGLLMTASQPRLPRAALRLRRRRWPWRWFQKVESGRALRWFPPAARPGFFPSAVCPSVCQSKLKGEVQFYTWGPDIRTTQKTREENC